VNRAREALTTISSFLLALVLGIAIWTNATQAEDPVQTRFLEVPLEYVGLPADTVLVDADPRQMVQIRLEGPDSILQALTPEEFAATVDLSRVPSGETVAVDIVVSGGRQGATISFITPEAVDVLLEQQVTREVPVELDLRGTVARGHNQLEPLLDPPTIRVAGAESRVNELDFALVTVFLNSTAETLVESSQPIFYDLAGRVASVTGLELSSDEVTVTVPVEEAAGFADKLVTVEWVGEPAPGYRLLSVTADPPSILVEGRPALVNRLTSVTTEPIDINGLTQTFEQTAVLELPEGVSVDPEQIVTVRIEVEPILTTSTFIRVPERRGLRSGFEATVEPAQVRVVVFGPLPVLDALAESDVRVILDLFGLEAGDYSIEPDVIVPDRGIEVRSIQPTAVSVTIVEETASALPLSAARTVQSGVVTGSALLNGATPTRAVVPMPIICPALTAAVAQRLPATCIQRQESQ
jgi:YbbR domain-containing protein